MIRAATVDDLAEIMDLAAVAMAELQPDYPFHRGAAAATVRDRINGPAGLVAVAMDGDKMIGGLTAQASVAPWCNGLQACCDLRFILPEYRGRMGHKLIRHFEAWGEGLGVKVLGVSQTGREATAYYERLGYHPAEMMFWKAL